MADITITNPSGKGFIRKKPLSYKRTLPDGWSDLDSVQLRFCLDQLLMYDNYTAKFWIVKKLLKLPKLIFVNLPEDVVAEMIELLSWMNLDATEKPLIESFEVDGVVYHLPSAKFENGIALEYPIADDYFIRFIQKGQMSDLKCLIATLCRPAKDNEKERISSGDPRQTLHNRSEVELRAKAFGKLPEHIQIAVLMYFAGVKNYVYRIYKGWIFPDDKMIDIDGSEIELTEEDTNSGSGPMFGWWSIYFDIAETGVFGTLDQVHQSNFHTICMYLVDKKKADEERRAKQQSANMNNHA